MDRLTREGVWTVVHQERRALVADLEDLPPDRWDTASLCVDWTIHDVVAHLVDTAKTTRLGFVTGMVRAGFDFDRQNAVGVRRERSREAVRTLEGLRSAIPRTTGPPAPLATRLVEAFLHGEDIRQPLGISRTYPPAPVVTALRHQLRTSVSMGGGREHAAGLRLTATDFDFDHGTGEEVGGRAIDLLLAISGRPVPPGSLAGDGVDRLRQRSGS
ncbi:hypothetical protein C6I20_01690 [Aeromicrobium sp. A1-2]|uniref:maleylpyruvate isomerase family mycothiol-dependent enzyme n=1 Tax=Aeromicrobium sp. A1-2 TaxID=2107713 RepID=UPI000E4A1427|nr:maleylpyruvate isomerase family mycothiol-dependent enzyme [Aeromicrobium sp. A1-2]AXT84031.1 hypothetical protein C6I20_01690 [Aeromicrobium sp. A1-2]